MGLSLILLAGSAGLPAAVPAAEDPGARTLQQHQLQRQQQQDALQLRMQQQYHATQPSAIDPRQAQALEQLQLEQRQRQQALHYRQSIEPPVAQPSDDTGTRRAKDAMEQLEARRQGQQELHRAELEQQRAAGKRNELGARVPVPTRDLKIPPSGPDACRAANACP